LAEIFRLNGISFPPTFSSSKELPRKGRWLVKPLNGAGGTGIHFVHSSPEKGSGKPVYFQEFVEGFPCSAVFVGFENQACLLGATRQLVGEGWVHAGRFHYCGSIGPLKLDPAIQKSLQKIGNVLNRDCHLRGLFGVDFVLSEGIPWPVEVNPRYPASVEIIEYALGIQALAFQRAAFDSEVRKPDSPHALKSVVGKAILFAGSSFEFPTEGPWRRTIYHPKPVEEMPDFADIPAPGQNIQAGRPILTFFSRSESVDGCMDNLKHIARDLDHNLPKT
jgi:predicted ATP-grasp superfamily ATP-dependent carboligase